jgi:hypothetical protein
MAFTELYDPYIGMVDADLQQGLLEHVDANRRAIMSQKPLPPAGYGHLGNQGGTLGHRTMSGRTAFPRRKQP